MPRHATSVRHTPTVLAAATLAIAFSLAACTSPGDSPGSPPSATVSGGTSASNYCPPPGTRVQRARWPDGAHLAPFTYIETPAGQLCRIATDTGRTYADLLGMRAFVTSDSEVQDLARAVAELFPLEIGKHSQGSIAGMGAHAGGNTSVWTLRFRVTGKETINGVETFVVTLREEGEAPNMYAVDSTAWIDPSLRVPVRVRHAPHSTGGRWPFAQWNSTAVLSR